MLCFPSPVHWTEILQPFDLQLNLFDVDAVAVMITRQSSGAEIGLEIQLVINLLQVILY